jgi:putative DNA primase/helicase
MNFQSKKSSKHKKISSSDGNVRGSTRMSKIWVEAELRDLDFDVYHLELGFNKERGQGVLTVARSAIQSPGEVLKELLDKGAALPFDKKAAKLLVEQAFQKTARRRKSITRRCGWAKDRSYVRPNFTVGPQKGSLNLHESVIDREIDGRKGNASEWRDGFCEACLASSYLSFGIGIGYGAPLLSIMGEDEGVIFNFHGESSTGKSLLGRACQSVFARARKNDVATYNLSGPGLDQLCFARNDLVIVLDEEGTAKGNRQKRREDIRRIAFTVPGGRGRIIDKNYRQEREMIDLTWRLFAISSGESPLEDKEVGNVRAAGERVRHVDIRVPERKKNGIFDRLEGTAKGRKSTAAAATVEATLADNYGVALKPYLVALIQTDPDQLEARVRSLVEDFVREVGADTDAWEQRFARKFGIVLAGMVLAAERDLAPWTVDHARRSVKRIYRTARRSVKTTEEAAGDVLQKLGKALTQKGRIPQLPEGKKLPSKYRGKAIGFRRTHRTLGAIVALDPKRLEEMVGSNAGAIAVRDHLLAGGSSEG